jgi:DNA/RNA endonuclease YhcR with UshA esterase domain
MNRAIFFTLVGILLIAASLYAYPTVTIRQIQEVPVGQDSSYYAGDTVHVGGIITAGTGLYYAGGGVTFYMEMSQGGPWSGIMAYSNTAQGYPALIPGDSIACDAVVYEYNYTGGRFCTMTELQILPGSFEFVSFGNPEPTPLLIPSATYIDSTGGADSLGEQYEGVYCRINDITVDTVIVYGNTSTWICSDSSGHQMMVREASDSISFLPSAGMTFAYVQGVIYHRFGCYNLQPRYLRDMQLPVGAPIITDPYHTPHNPINAGDTDKDSVRITANVVDNGTVTSVLLFYRFNLGGWQSIAMTNGGSGDNYSFRFPPLPAGYRVDYYVQATDNDNEIRKNPDQAPISFYQFKIQNPQTKTIAQAKIDANTDFVPDMLDSAVILTGVATTFNFSTTKTDFYMQDNEAGINVYYATALLNVNIGDSVKVSGIVTQYNGKTQLQIFKAARLQNLASGRTFDTLRVTCSQLGDDVGELNEGKLIMVRSANISDGPNSWPTLGNSSTMTITDGTGSTALRIDLSTNIPGQTQPQNAVQIVGVLGQYDSYSPYNSGYQLMPRRYLDLTHVTAINDQPILPNTTALNQNYPNPFNSSTLISFNLAKPGDVSLTIYDVLGRKVFEETKTNVPTGQSSILWTGHDLSGKTVSTGMYFYRLKTADFDQTMRMLLLK